MVLFFKKMVIKYCFYFYVKRIIFVLCFNNKRKVKNVLKLDFLELLYSLFFSENYQILSIFYVQKGESDDFGKLLIVYFGQFIGCILVEVREKFGVMRELYVCNIF